MPGISLTLRFILAGTPATKTFAGISLITIAPASTVVHSPTLTLFMTQEFAPR